jgi:hypothetical protein
MCVSYPDVITFRVSRAMRADLERLAVEHQTDVGKLLRRLVAREATGGPDRIAEALNQLLFVALALEGLLQAHPDRELHPTIVQLWRDRLVEEKRHAA